MLARGEVEVCVDPLGRGARRQHRAALAVGILSLLTAACGDQGAPTPRPAEDPPWFADVSQDAGLRFRHEHGGSGRRYMMETLAGGGGFLDFDNDGWLDIYLVQSGPTPDATEAAPLPNQLFRNRGDGTFENVTAGSGAGDSGYGMGACFGDIDNDGWVDLYVTNFGPDVLLRNAGDGRFTPVTDAAGIDNAAWAASCAFGDYDGDGCLDLYVVNYVDFALSNHRLCGSVDRPMYCHPDIYQGVPDRLYRNRCDGTFQDVTEAAGVRNDDPRQGKGLGALWADLDDDGLLDLYVANDSTRNFLYHNLGDGRFEDIGVVSGTAFNEQGATEAGMGVAAGDFDGDGRLDLLVTHLDFETNTLYRNEGAGLFVDQTSLSGLGPPSKTRVGFGVNAFDFDHDGDLDLFVANGHIIDNINQINSTLSYAQGNQLFRNDGHGRFSDVSGKAGDPFRRARVSRASAVGDTDNDGDLDVLIVNSNQPTALLRNDAGAGGRWIQLRLISRHGGRDAIGARVRLVAGELERVAEVRSGGSYLAQNDLRLHFGLGPRTRIDRLEVRWPEGDTQVIPGSELSVGSVNVIRQPRELHGKPAVLPRND